MGMFLTSFLKIENLFFFSWLDHVEREILSNKETVTDNISWSAYHASKQQTEREIDLSVLLPLFQEESKSVAMIKHGMDVIMQATNHINEGQTPVLTFDQPLYTIAKTVQWNWKEFYGEEKFVVMMGALHIEMAALKTLGIDISQKIPNECYNRIQKND